MIHFDAWDGELANGWDSARGDSTLDWQQAKPAVREAWYRISDLAERAKSERAELLSTSPLPHTPVIIDRGRPEIEPDLAEWDYGDYEGKRTVDCPHRRQRG